MIHDEECRRRLAQLEEENTHLRRSAEEFGQLAERLNTELRAERRAEPERRQAPRTTPDRRLEIR
jgi:hypothetical protein